jgi:hypothetical protein
LGYTPPTSNTTYNVVTNATDGLVPKFDSADGTIDNSSNDWVLTNNNGSIGWYKLPANAFKNDNTVYTHPTTSGNKHIPAGGSSGQILRWSADGTAAWGSDNNTTYSAGTGLSLSGTTFSNSGVRSIATGSTNGTISVNTNGTSANVKVKGLGTAAYQNTETFASKTEGVVFIEGTGTTNETDKTSSWTGESTRITAYYDGLTIRYKIGVVG